MGAFTISDEYLLSPHKPCRLRCKFFERDHATTFPHFAVLISVAVALRVTNAGCERGFSTQNRLKTKLRNRLLEGKLDILMRLSIEGPVVQDYNYSQALAVWKGRKACRLLGQWSCTT